MFRMAGENVVLVFLGVVTLSCSIYVVKGTKLCNCKGKDECPPNEEYLLCGPACPVNCTSFDGPDTCTEECVEGCFCNVGLVRDQNGTCVAPDKCSTKPMCAENEKFQNCGTSCEATCEQPLPGLCDMACRVGCFCKQMFVRDGTSGKCIAVEECSAEPCLNENEVYDSCNGACEPSCSDPEPICNKICMGGCICSPGLLRSDAGDCVSVDKCAQNGTNVTLLAKYLNAINKILHL